MRTRNQAKKEDPSKQGLGNDESNKLNDEGAASKANGHAGVGVGESPVIDPAEEEVIKSSNGSRERDESSEKDEGNKAEDDEEETKLVEE